MRAFRPRHPSHCVPNSYVALGGPAVLLALVAIVGSPARAQAVEWVRAFGAEQEEGYSQAEGRSIAPDGSGGVFVAGWFYDGVDLDGDGSLDLESTRQNVGTSPYPPSTDGFVARYDAAGTPLWARGLGSPYDDRAFAVATDGEGGLYVTGQAYDADLDGDGVPDVFPDRTGGTFVARYDGEGGLLWVHGVSGDRGVTGRGVAADGSGGVFVTGNFGGRVDFDGDGSADVRAGSRNDVFLARYDGDGTFRWVRHGSHNVQVGYDVAADGSGGVFVASAFSGAADFDGDGEADAVSTPNSNGNPTTDGFVARYDADGAFLWVEPFGGDGQDAGLGVVGDGAGGVFVTGYTTVYRDEDTGPSSSADVFVARYGADGSRLWTQHGGGRTADQGYGVVADGEGGVYVTGGFNNRADFDGDGFVVVTSVGGCCNPVNDEPYYTEDAFVARYDGAGALRWVSRYGGEAKGGDEGRGLATDGEGGLYVTGRFHGPVDFDGDGGVDFTTSFVEAYVPDGFVARLVPTETTLAAGADAGAERLEVASTAPFSIGDEIVLCPGCPNEETNTVVGFGSLLLKDPLRYAHDASEVVALAVGTAVAAEPGAAPDESALHAPYPNPLRRGATVPYTLTRPGAVEVAVFDALGRRVATLVDGEHEAGTHQAWFDPDGLPAGAYFVRMRSGAYDRVERVVLLP